MANDHNAPADMDEFYHDLRELLDACAGTSRHDQAKVGISYCIDQGLDTGPRIIGALRWVGFKPRHIGAILHANSGSDPARHYWQRDDAGHYRNLPSA